MTDINVLFNTWSLVITLCTSMFNIQTLYILPTQHIDVLCMDLKQLLFLPYTASTSWFFNRVGECFEVQTDSLNTADYVSPLKG